MLGGTEENHKFSTVVFRQTAWRNLGKPRIQHSSIPATAWRDWRKPRIQHSGIPATAWRTDENHEFSTVVFRQLFGGTEENHTFSTVVFRPIFRIIMHKHLSRFSAGANRSITSTDKPHQRMMNMNDAVRMKHVLVGKANEYLLLFSILTNRRTQYKS